MTILMDLWILHTYSSAGMFFTEKFIFWLHENDGLLSGIKSRHIILNQFEEESEINKDVTDKILLALLLGV